MVRPGPAPPEVHEQAHSEPGRAGPVNPRIPPAFAAPEHKKKAQGKLSLGFASSLITHHSSLVTLPFDF